MHWKAFWTGVTPENSQRSLENVLKQKTVCFQLEIINCIHFSSFTSGDRVCGKWTLHSADTGRADHAGGEAANRPVQERRQDRRAWRIHWQPAGPCHRWETQHPASS